MCNFVHIWPFTRAYCRRCTDSAQYLTFVRQPQQTSDNGRHFGLQNPTHINYKQDTNNYMKGELLCSEHVLSTGCNPRYEAGLLSTTTE